MDVLDVNFCTINNSAEPTNSSNVSVPSDNLSTINFDKPITCRLCLSTNANYFLDIYESVNSEQNIADIIAKHFWFIKVLLKNITLLQDIYQCIIPLSAGLR